MQFHHAYIVHNPIQSLTQAILSQEEVDATVEKCSTQGRSCVLILSETGVSCFLPAHLCRLSSPHPSQTNTYPLSLQESVSLNIAKCPYTILSSKDNANEGDDDDIDEEEEEGEEEEDLSDSEEEEDEDKQPGVYNSEDDGDWEPGEDDIADTAIEDLADVITNDPACILQGNEDVAQLARAAAKEIFDYASQHADNDNNIADASLLPELYVDGFDAEQIWLQIDLQSGPLIKKARKLLKKVGPNASLLTEETEEMLEDLLEEGDKEGDDDKEDEEEEEEEEQEEEEDIDYDEMLANGGLESEEEEAEEEEDEPSGRKSKPNSNNNKKKGGRSTVEDDYLNLDDMEAFLEQAEMEEEDDEGGDGDSEEEDDLDAALDPEAPDTDDEEEAELNALLEEEMARNKKKTVKFSEMDDDDDDDEEEEEDGEGGDMKADYRYEDFFDPPGHHGTRKHNDDEEEKLRRGTKRQKIKHSLLDDDDYDGDDGFDDEDDDDVDAVYDDDRGGGDFLNEEEEEDEDEEEEDDELVLSAHERRLARLATKARALEEQAMGDKHWTLTGEVAGSSRPKNSALGIDLDFETTVKPPPPPSEEVTLDLEQLIKHRIEEAQWDDVIKIASTSDLLGGGKKRKVVELDDKKSNQGLADMYEQDYVAAVTGTVDDKQEEVRRTARAQFTALCAKLDRLSHLHFAPKPALEEVTVKVDAPALVMEEAAPAFVSEAALKAPEEIHVAANGNAAAALKADEELTKEERSARRAAKKRGKKKQQAQFDADKAARQSQLPGGRKSAVLDEEARKMAKAHKKKTKAMGGPKKSDYTKSARVFSKIAATIKGGGKGEVVMGGGNDKPATHLKL
jgi:U3 small nucleolar RNA-associated protein MPP10